MDEDEEFQSSFNDTDPNEKATKINNSLNKVAEKLIAKKKIQNRKDMRDFDDAELRKARDKIKEQSKVAHQNNDIEEMRYLKNLKNAYSKLEKSKKTDHEKKVLSKINSK